MVVGAESSLWYIAVATEGTTARRTTARRATPTTALRCQAHPTRAATASGRAQEYGISERGTSTPRLRLAI